MISPTGSDPSSQKPQAGFTLLELLVVLLIFSIVLGLSTPLFSRTFSHLKLEIFSSNMARLLDYAGNRAVATRSRMRVHFDREGGRYWLLQAQGVSSESSFERVTDKWGRTYWDPDGVSVDPSTPDVTFYPDGTADPFKLIILDHGKIRYRLVTHVWTGRVSLIKADGN